MHVLYFHQHYSTRKGATGIRSYEMARSLLRHGHTVTMVCGSYGVASTGLEGDFRRGRREGIVDGIHVVEFDLSYSNYDGIAKRIWTFSRFSLAGVFIALGRKYDLVFATTTPLTAGIPGICARWLRRKPFVFEVRDLWPELPKAMGVIKNPILLFLLSMLEWISYRSAHRIVGLSPGIVNGIKARGVSEDRIQMIPNGCDLDIFSAPDIVKWRPKSVRPDEILAIFAGTHGQANGLDTVLDAAEILKNRGRNDIRILFVGDGKLKGQLKTRATQANLDNVMFRDPVDKAKLAGLFKGSDIGLQILANIPAFYYGTSPNKFFDYIASGLPVLNNYPGWVADIIANHNCGVVVEPDNPTAMANALEHAADNRDSLQIMGKRAAFLAAQKFDRQKLSHQWVEWVMKGELS